MKRFALLLLLFIGPVLLSGLTGCTDCGSDSGPTRYNLDNYEFHVQRGEPNQPGSLPVKPVTAGNTLTARDLELVLLGKVTYVTYQGGGGNLFACDPAIIPLNNISRMRVVSDQLYSLDLPAGSDLTSVLSIGSVRYNRTPLFDYLTMKEKPALDYYQFGQPNWSILFRANHTLSRLAERRQRRLKKLLT